MKNLENSLSSIKNERLPNGISPKNINKLIGSPDPEKRKKVALWLVTKKDFDESSHLILKRLIKDEDRSVWTAASSALGNFAFANSKARDYLYSLVDDDFYWIKKRGIFALGEFARFDSSGVARLSKLTQSSKKEVVAEAISVMGKVALENKKAQAALTKLTKSQDEVVLQPTISTMGLLAKRDDDILSQLQLLLKNKNNFIRLWCASAIGEAATDNEKAFSLLWKFSDHEDVYLRRGYSKKIAVLTKKMPKETLKLIQEAVSDDDRYVRTNSVSALGILCENNKGAFAKIKELLYHENADVRRGAAIALLNVPQNMETQILPLISEMVHDRDYYLRSKAAFLSVKMAIFSPNSATAFLNELVNDKDEYVRRDLAMALGELPKESKLDVIPILKKLLSDRENIVRREAVLALCVSLSANSQEVLFLITNLSSDNDENVRENACELLGILAEDFPNQTFSHIIRYVGDESQQVREKAAFCLEKIFDQKPESVFERIRILQKENIDPKIFYMISKYAKNDEIESICQFYTKVAGDLRTSNLEVLLIYASEVFKKVTKIKHSSAFGELYKAFLAGIRVRDINDLALIRFDSSDLQVVNDLQNADDLKVFEILTNVPEMALRYKQIQGISDKHIYLGKMLGLIDSTFEDLTQDSLPETQILESVLHNWRHMVSQTMDTLKGRSDLKLSLRTKKVIPQDTVTLLLGLENVGESLAENLSVTLMPSPSYKRVDKIRKIVMLAHERSDALEFMIKPSKRKTFRVKFKINWDDFEKAGKSLVFADRVSFIDVPKEFMYIPNPYITGGPIKPPSKDMFFGRDDVFAFISDNIDTAAQKNVLILQGERRTGKTSILYQIPRVLGSDYISVFMDGQEFGGSTLDYFFFKMAKLISASCRSEGIEINPPSRADFKSDPWYIFKDRFLEELKKVIGKRYIVILFDEFEALEHAVTSKVLDPMIFNYVRNLMQHEEKLVFIFAGVHRLEEMMEDYWGVMFNIAMYWRISFLKEGEARKLISKPVEGYNMIYDDLALEKIIRATANHPYFIQLLCRFLVNRHNNEKRNYITVQDVNEELVNVIEKAKPHFDYIWTLSTNYEKLILSLLVATLRMRTIVTHKDLLDECDRLGLSVNKKKFSKALTNLTDKDILKMVTEGAVHYQFKVDFIRMWVERYQPLSKVVQELGEEFTE